MTIDGPNSEISPYEICRLYTCDLHCPDEDVRGAQESQRCLDSYTLTTSMAIVELVSGDPTSSCPRQRTVEVCKDGIASRRLCQDLHIALEEAYVLGSDGHGSEASVQAWTAAKEEEGQVANVSTFTRTKDDLWLQGHMRGAPHVTSANRSDVLNPRWIFQQRC